MSNGYDDANAACRQELGKHIGGIYFDPKLRTMQVVIPAAASPADVRDFQREVVDIVRGTTAKGGENAWPFTIRVTAKTPRGDVTPVDAASVSFYRGLARLVHHHPVRPRMRRFVDRRAQFGHGPVHTFAFRIRRSGNADPSMAGGVGGEERAMAGSVRVRKRRRNDALVRRTEGGTTGWGNESTRID